MAVPAYQQPIMKWFYLLHYSIAHKTKSHLHL